MNRIKMNRFNSFRYRSIGLLTLCCCGLLATAASGQTNPAATSNAPAAAAPLSEQKPVYFEQDVAASNPLRNAQAAELERYIAHLKSDASRLQQILTPDYTSIEKYQASVEPYRRAFAQSIGYPPPGAVPAEPAQFEKIGEDAIGIYYRAIIPVLPEVHAEGLYITPKNVTKPAPLVIAMHGGGGSPEVALFKGGANYHDMVRGGVKRGYAVFAPQHLFKADAYPADIRRQIDNRLRHQGTSITAVEIAKITRSLDVLLQRPEVDPTRVAMVGLSYGGFYTLVTTALEPRIHVAASSCYYGVQESRYRENELSVPSDFCFMDRFSLFRDDDLVALIAPRPLHIQAGKKDGVHHREAGIEMAPRSASYYEKLGKRTNFEHLVFEGGHEFHDASAWRFVDQHLQGLSR